MRWRPSSRWRTPRLPPCAAELPRACRWRFSRPSATTCWPTPRCSAATPSSLADARKRVNRLPLGAAALAGSYPHRPRARRRGRWNSTACAPQFARRGVLRRLHHRDSAAPPRAGDDASRACREELLRAFSRADGQPGRDRLRPHPAAGRLRGEMRRKQLLRPGARCASSPARRPRELVGKVAVGPPHRCSTTPSNSSVPWRRALDRAGAGRRRRPQQQARRTPRGVRRAASAAASRWWRRRAHRPAGAPLFRGAASRRAAVGAVVGRCCHLSAPSARSATAPS